MTGSADKEKLIVIAGPTASGKTGISLKLAELLKTEVVSADSMQVYRGMDIGTAKITPSEMRGIPHHMIDVCDPHDNFNVWEYKERAEKAIRDIQKRGMIPVLCGGTGFYIQSVLYDIDFTEEGADERIRNDLRAFCEENGKEALHDMLSEVDPASAAAIPSGDVKRVIRAIEFFKLHGTTISEHNAGEEIKRAAPVYDTKFFVLTCTKEKLYRRIDERVDRMIAEGLEGEVRELLNDGVPPENTSMQAIGYRQMAAYLRGECSLEDAVRRIKTDSRHYAKRQITWFKREEDTILINTDEGDPFDEIRKYLW